MSTETLMFICIGVAAAVVVAITLWSLVDRSRWR